MILRKPYAFLIKHFKAIHLLLALITAYIIFKMNNVMTFMDEYVATGYYNTISESAGSIVTITMFLAILMVAIISTVVLVLMRLKRKPIRVYIYNIIASIVFFIMNLVMLFFLQALELETMELRMLRIIRDLYYLFTFVNYPILLFALIRGFGFDIKKFNFGEDIEQLQIDVADREEFEVTINIDSDLIKRKARRQKREFGYFVRENKGILLILTGTIGSILLVFTILRTFVYNPYYEQGQSFNVSNIILTVTDVYATTKDYKGNNVANANDAYVIIKFKTQNNNDYNTSLMQNYFNLLVNGKRYEIEMMKAKDFFDLGEVYQNQTLLAKKEKYYTLVFKIPRKDIDKEMIFRYRESISFTLSSFEAFYKQVKLKATLVDEEKDIGNYLLGDTINFNDTMLKDTTLTINKINIKDTFTHTFKYCVADDLCNDTDIYITPNSLASQDKTVLELDMDLNIANGVTLKYASNKYDFINEFGTIQYVLNGVIKKHDIALENRTPKYNYTGSSIYIEVLEEVKDASRIDIVFYIRGRKYTYHLKG